MHLLLPYGSPKRTRPNAMKRMQTSTLLVEEEDDARQMRSAGHVIPLEDQSLPAHIIAMFMTSSSR